MKIPDYTLNEPERIFSPGLVIFRDAVESNIDAMIAIAGGTAQLRPHCKTHKMSAVVRLQLEKGISKHKAATLAECEMLATAGAPDIMLAYNPIGPNIARTVAFRQEFPDVTLHVTTDHADPLRALSAAMTDAGQTVSVLLDVDSGLHRTGIAPGDAAADLYKLIDDLPGVIPGGFHVYDGHNHQSDFDERAAAVAQQWGPVQALRTALQEQNVSVPRLVCGGTGSFPVYAEMAQDDAAIETSPGTCVFYDVGYGGRFADLDFHCAAVVLTRVISRPTSDRMTLDLGNKAVAADPPAGKRVWFPDLPDAEQVLQNEEHLVLETPRAGDYAPGDVLLAIPRHICPTSALYRSATVVRDGAIVDQWNVEARDRQITI